MASFEAKALTRSTGRSGGRTIRQRRLPYHLVEPTVIAADLVIVVAISLLAGIGYNWVFLGVVPATATQTYTAIGVLTFTNVSAVLAARGDYRVNNLVRFYQQARHLAIIWTGIFLVLVGVAFSLKVAESFSRGAVLTFLCPRPGRHDCVARASRAIPWPSVVCGRLLRTQGDPDRRTEPSANLAHDIGNAAMRLHPNTNVGDWAGRMRDN